MNDGTITIFVYLTITICFLDDWGHNDKLRNKKISYFIYIFIYTNE